MSKLYVEPYSVEEIKQKRMKLGYSQRALAALAGVNRNTMSSIECSRSDSLPIRMLLTIILDDLETMDMMKEDEKNGSDL